MVIPDDTPDYDTPDYDRPRSRGSTGGGRSRLRC